VYYQHFLFLVLNSKHFYSCFHNWIYISFYVLYFAHWHHKYKWHTQKYGYGNKYKYYRIKNKEETYRHCLCTWVITARRVTERRVMIKVVFSFIFPILWCTHGGVLIYERSVELLRVLEIQIVFAYSTKSRDQDVSFQNSTLWLACKHFIKTWFKIIIIISQFTIMQSSSCTTLIGTIFPNMPGKG